ncbi:hypothetical protein UlMin_008538 [Ulmus minor]
MHNPVESDPSKALDHQQGIPLPMPLPGTMSATNRNNYNGIKNFMNKIFLKYFLYEPIFIFFLKVDELAVEIVEIIGVDSNYVLGIVLVQLQLELIGQTRISLVFFAKLGNFSFQFTLIFMYFWWLYTDKKRNRLLIFVFEPEIKGDLPEKVEYIGMKNLINAVKGSVGIIITWSFCGELLMILSGGVSESIFQIDRTRGVVSTENNGGFATIRTKDLWLVYFYEMNIGYIHFFTSIFICYQNFSAPEDLSAYDGLELHLKGDGHRYKLVVRTSSEWDALVYATGFDTVSGQWQSVRFLFLSLKPIFRAQSVSDAPPFDPTNVVSLQLMFSKFEYDGKLNPTFVEGPFQLSVSSIWAYLKDPISPRLCRSYLARPRLDLSKQPLVVRLNKELHSILTFKLKGEDLIRESGIPYAIMRPCALTEEPISSKEVACICIAALASPYALDKTFEVKSVIPFSEPFMVDPENLPPEKDYNIYFKNLKDGITGKEILL